jgi:hypothetical protein
MADADTQTFDERAGTMFDNPSPAGLPEWMQGATAAPPSLSDTPAGSEGGGGGGGSNLLTDPVLQSLQHAGEGLMQGERANTAKMVGQLDASAKDINSVPVPQLGKSPEAPKAQLGQGVMEYMQFATVLASLAGGLARNNASVALTAFAGAVKGFTEGKKEVFQSKIEEWKAASEQMKSDNQAKLDQYELILKNKKMSMDMKLASMKLVATQYSDEITYNLAEQKNYTQLAMLNEREKQMQHNMANADERLRQGATNIQMKVQQQEDLVNNANAEADMVESGLAPPTPANLGKYRANQYVMKKLNSDKFDLSKAQLEWAAATKQIQSLYGPQLTRFKATATSVVNTIDEVKALSEQLKQSGVPLINKAQLASVMQAKGNSPEGQLATRYLTAVNTLKEEFATLAQGGYAPTESVWALTNQQIDQNYGVNQMNASLSEIQRLVRYRMSAFEQLDPLHKQIGGSSGSEAAPAAPAAGGSGVDDAMKRLGL